jgi:hypothetical protein
MNNELRNNNKWDNSCYVHHSMDWTIREIPWENRRKPCLFLVIIEYTFWQ